jgi:hypothetical protein
VNAVHLALETLYTELPALADELGEACRFDFDITLDHTVVINESNPVKACFDLRNDLLSLQKDMPGYINSMIDAINGLLTSVMYKMVRLGGLAKPAIEVVTEAAARGWSEYSVQEKLNALKLAIMSDGLAYDAEDYVGKDLKDMPKELQVALEIVTAVNDSFINEGYSAKAYNKVIDSMTVEEIIDIMSKFDDKNKDMRKTDKGSLTMIATHVRKPSDMGPAKEVKEYILKKYEDKLKKADELMSATKPGKPADGSGRINESLSLSKKRSVIAALKYVNEELEVGAELKCLKDLTTTDGTVIPAGSTVSYTGIDSNTNVATVTFDENSYAVTIPDLTAATQQMGPAI